VGGDEDDPTRTPFAHAAVIPHRHTPMTDGVAVVAGGQQFVIDS
jgi:hypothetical protein